MIQSGTDPRRRYERVKTMLEALVLLERGQSVVKCTVRNMSEGGALVLLDQSTMIPEFFQLSIPSRRQIHNCRIAWRSGLQIGAQFITHTTLAGPSSMRDMHSEKRSPILHFLFSLTKAEQICLALAIIFACVTAIFALG